MVSWLCLTRHGIVQSSNGLPCRFRDAKLNAQSDLQPPYPPELQQSYEAKLEAQQQEPVEILHPLQQLQEGFCPGQIVEISFSMNMAALMAIDWSRGPVKASVAGFVCLGPPGHVEDFYLTECADSGAVKALLVVQHDSEPSDSMRMYRLSHAATRKEFKISFRLVRWAHPRDVSAMSSFVISVKLSYNLVSSN